jgi:hypothetical protein
MLRPGYIPPTRKSLAGPLLDSTKKQLEEEMRKRLLGKDCTLIEDGWSNIHNDPIAAICLHVDGEAFFLEATDTKANKKTAEYCKGLVQKAMKTASDKYGCRVRNVVTDNAKSMEKMRQLLHKDDDDLIVYGCSSHLLNLLGESLTSADVIKHIVEIQKYFRNHHSPSAWLKEIPNTVKPQLPGNTRWNSQLTCIETFLRNRPAYLTISQNHEEDMERRIVTLINDFNLYRNAKDTLSQLKPVAVALDKLQSDKSSLAEACHQWISLLENESLRQHYKVIEKRFKQAIQPFHLMAYILHPSYGGSKLNAEQREEARQWCRSRNSSFLPLLIAYDTQSSPFPSSFFLDEVVKSLKPEIWWKGVLKDSKSEVCAQFSNLAIRLLTAPASSAAVERIFSNFGFVHSKLRNRLKSETAAKLVFCYRMLRMQNTDASRSTESNMDNDDDDDDDSVVELVSDSDSESVSQSSQSGTDDD